MRDLPAITPGGTTGKSAEDKGEKKASSRESGLERRTSETYDVKVSLEARHVAWWNRGCWIMFFYHVCSTVLFRRVHCMSSDYKRNLLKKSTLLREILTNKLVQRN